MTTSTALTIPYSAWFDAGFTDLVSVVPPGAPLSEGTKLRPEDRGKVPGIQGRGGYWFGFSNWQKHETTRGDAETWEGHGANLGLRAARFPGLDLDVTCPDLRDLCQGLADRVLGPAPARTGRAPKVLLVYRLAEGQTPMVRRRLWFKGPDGREHLVEMLGQGQQYVVAGIHPITQRPYSWDTHPVGRSAAALSPVTHAQIDEFFAELRDLLDSAGGCADIREEGSGAEVTDRAAIVQDDLLAPSLDVLAAAVATIPNDNDRFPNRTDYLRMGCAIKAAGADDPDRAMEVWEEWAQRWEGNATVAGNDPVEVVSDWERMKPPFEVGWGYVRDVAQEHGFPVAAGEFPDELPDDLMELLPEEDDELELIDPTQWEGVPIPEREWIVPGWLPVGYVGALYGDGGLGKTILAVMLAVASVTEKKWLGMDVRKCRVVGLFCEDEANELHRRMGDSLAHYGCTFKDLSGMKLISRVAKDNALCVFDRDGKLLETKLYKKLIGAINMVQPNLVIIDTAADTFGGNENIRTEVRLFISRILGNIARLMDQWGGGAVLLLAHPSRDGMATGRGDGGNTAWNNTVRARWYLTRPDVDKGSAVDRDARVLQNKKANYAASETGVNLRWRAGVFEVDDDVLADVPETPLPTDRAERASYADKVFLDALGQLRAQKRNTSDGKTAINYAPKMIRTLPAAAGLSFRELEDAKDRLFNAGVIKNGVVFRDERRKPRSGIVLSAWEEGAAKA
ncbi:AAA family ATPase [Azospirillum palustre]|nr:AAA family ATPase [Azospirillum palustre]